MAVGSGGGRERGGQRVQREHIPLRGSHSSTNTAPPEGNTGASEPALLTADDSGGGGLERWGVVGG